MKDKIIIFLVYWFFVLIINQVFLFGACFNPVCLIAAIPHTALISYFLYYFFEVKRKIQNENIETDKDIKNDNLNNTYTAQKKEQTTQFKKIDEKNVSQDFLKAKGDIYEKLIGKQFEIKGEVVIYNGFIRGYEDQGVDIISLSLNTKSINLIQCKNWTRKPMLLNDVELIHKKLSDYQFDIWGLSDNEIKHHSHYSNNSIDLSKIINEIKNDFNDFTIRKTLYLSSDKIIDLNIGAHLILIQQNIFRYKDMKIVIYSE